jgi:hypothetical protein
MKRVSLNIISGGIFIAFMLSFTGVIFAQQLEKKTEQALIDAINDEYKARAVYQKVTDKFGSVQPFSNIIKAEATHIAELKVLFTKYGIAVPKDDWYGKVPAFATLQEACAGGVQAEIDNVKMYDGFFKFVKEKDIIAVFKRLRDASQDKHLPAFKKCADGSGSQGQGGGKQGGGRNKGK